MTKNIQILILTLSSVIWGQYIQTAEKQKEFAGTFFTNTDKNYDVFLDTSKKHLTCNLYVQGGISGLNGKKCFPYEDIGSNFLLIIPLPAHTYNACLELEIGNLKNKSICLRYSLQLGTLRNNTPMEYIAGTKQVLAETYGNYGKIILNLFKPFESMKKEINIGPQLGLGIEKTVWSAKEEGAMVGIFDTLFNIRTIPDKAEAKDIKRIATVGICMEFKYLREVCSKITFYIDYPIVLAQSRKYDLIQGESFNTEINTKPGASLGLSIALYKFNIF
jgi:hypothetical protein